MPPPGPGRNVRHRSRPGSGPPVTGRCTAACAQFASRPARCPLPATALSPDRRGKVTSDAKPRGSSGWTGLRGWLAAGPAPPTVWTWPG